MLTYSLRRIFLSVILATSNLLFYSSSEAGSYPVNVTSFGAKCDGITDDTAAINAAIANVTGNFTNTSGGSVVFPSGVCVIGTITGQQQVVLQDVSLVGAEVPHFSDAPAGTGIVEAGTTLSVGTAAIAPSTSIAPFSLGHSVTIRGLNIIYPYQIAMGLVNNAPVAAASTFSDNGQEVSNILFDNVHVIGSYIFWTQNQGPSPTYGNIRFTNTDIYAINTVFYWLNVQETVAFQNVLFNPSLCNGGSGGCSNALKNWTSDNGIWLHVAGGTGSTGYKSAVAGIVASNFTVSSYKIGIIVDSNGHLDESVFGPTSTFDGVPIILYVNSNGSITHTVFSGKGEFGGSSRSGTFYSTPAFTLNNPQYPLSGDLIRDHNTLSLNGFSADGVAGPLLSAVVSTGDIGIINIANVSVRGYCSGSVTTDAIDVSTPNNTSQSTALIITGSEIITGKTGCGGVSAATNGAPYINANNLIGYYPLN